MTPTLSGLDIVLAFGKGPEKVLQKMDLRAVGTRAPIDSVGVKKNWLKPSEAFSEKSFIFSGCSLK